MAHSNNENARMQINGQSLTWETQLPKAVALLKSGECVGMPTETVYGLAGDALNPNAVAKVFEIKRRPAFDPLIIHVTADLPLEDYVILNETAQLLMEQFWPGPLTLLMEKTDLISDLVTSGHPTVAVRCPAHPAAQALINAYGRPLVAPSANRFGQLSPTSVEAVRLGLKGEVELILEGGGCRIGLESTIVDTTADWPELPVLRFGGIPVEDLSSLGYTLSYPTPIIGQAPGTLKNHYAPSIPLYLWDKEYHDSHIINNGKPIDPKLGAWLGWREHNADFAGSFVLSEVGDLRQAAYRVFSLLRALSEQDFKMIIAELPPNKELGRAIRDRLKRGASGYLSNIKNVWSLIDQA